MLHTFGPRVDLEPRNGSIAGFARTCECGFEIRSSLEVLLEQWCGDHVRYMERKEGGAK